MFLQSIFGLDCFYLCDVFFFQIDSDLVVSASSNVKLSCRIHITKGKQTLENSSSRVDVIFGKRPDLASEIAALASVGMNALVYVCGPDVMVEQASVQTQKCGVDFKHETFLL